MCIGSQTGGALLPNGGAGWAGGKAERILIIIILSPPISWNKAKLALVNPQSLVLRCCSLVLSTLLGPSPALQVNSVSIGAHSEPGPQLALAAAVESPEQPSTSLEGNN